MPKVTRIEWTFHTSGAEGAGTDSPVSVEILRDGQMLANVWQERGETARLDRGETGTYWWTFQNPTGIGTAVSGQAVPYTEDFPNGISGHLQVRLRIHGDDAWRIGVIDSAVVSGDMDFIPGTIDSWRWIETRHGFHFAGEDVLSTDTGEGLTTLVLNY